MPAGQRAVLPTGLLSSGSRVVDAWLRPLCGADELLVHEATDAGAPRAAIATALLAACTTAIGAMAPVDEETADLLCVGDREALLLQLRRATFGDAIQAVVPCPACGELLDLDLRVRDLLLPTQASVSAEETLTLDVAGSAWRVTLRRVTGADQRAVATQEEPDRILLRRCVRRVTREDGIDWPVPELPAELAAAIDRALADLDPQAEIRLELHCVTCGQGFDAPFDAGAHLLAELAAESAQLLQEVALLARHLHWREADILALPRARRKAYAALAAQR